VSLYRFAQLALLMIVTCCLNACDSPKSNPKLLTYSNIDKAQQHSSGKGAVIAVLDWQFDLSGKESEKYIHPTSLVPGEEIGELKPWHGEWMAEIVHTIAPDAKIIPIKARGLKKESYQAYVIEGIRLAADHGAVAVTCSMGPVYDSSELDAAITYAEERGTVFVNVHPEFVATAEGENRICETGECDNRIISTGAVSVPDYPVEPEECRDIYIWPYDLVAHWEDGWGYSNGPPTVAGVIALMYEIKPTLKPSEIRQIITDTASLKEGFRVLDGEAAIQNCLSQSKL